MINSQFKYKINKYTILHWMALKSFIEVWESVCLYILKYDIALIKSVQTR